MRSRSLILVIALATLLVGFIAVPASANHLTGNGTNGPWNCSNVENDAEPYCQYLLAVTVGSVHVDEHANAPSPPCVPAPGMTCGAAGAPTGGAVAYSPPLQTTADGSSPAVAGDDLAIAANVYSKCTSASLCGNIMVDLHYATIDGGTKVLSEEVPPEAAQSVPFTIPGGDVYWWNTATRSPYVFGYWFEVSQVQNNVPVIARAPTDPTQMYERAVTIVIRSRVLRPDGQPSVGTAVHWYPDSTGEAFRTYTDAEGKFELAVPNSDHRIQALAADPGFVNVRMWVFEGTPIGEVTQTVDVSGFGARITYTASLGQPQIGAKDSEVQDQTFILKDQPATFYPASSDPPNGLPPCDPPPPGPFGACEEKVEEKTVEVPISGYDEWVTIDGQYQPLHRYTIGADSDMQTNYHVTHSIFTEIGTFFKASSGSVGWVGGETTETSKTMTEGSVWIPGPGSGNWAANTNYGNMKEIWKQGLYKMYACYQREYCYIGKEWRPERWHGGQWTQPEEGFGISYHGDYRGEESDGARWLIGNNFEVAFGSGERSDVSFNVEVGAAKWLPLKINFGSTKVREVGVESRLTWQGLGQIPACYYVFSRGLDPDGEDPFANPGRMWTYSEVVEDVSNCHIQH